MAPELEVRLLVGEINMYLYFSIVPFLMIAGGLRGVQLLDKILKSKIAENLIVFILFNVVEMF